MRILYIANRADIFSGGQISLLELLKRIDTDKYEPVVLCPGEGEMSEEIRKMGFIVKLWDMPSAKNLNIKRTYKKIRELNALVKSLSVDLVHTNGSRAQFYAAGAIKGTGSRLLWHVREAKRDNIFYDRYLGKSSDKILCVSKGVAKDRFRRYPALKNKIQVIYNGVDVQAFTKNKTDRNIIRNEWGIRQDEVLIGIVGLLCPRKGHKYLFEALKRIPGVLPKIRVLIVGEAIDAEYYIQLNNMVKVLGLNEKVIFSGPRSDIRAVLSALDIFVLPSSSEGFSRVLLEAMACSCSIITTDVEGNNEAVINGESGVLVPFGDAGKLAKEIEELIFLPEKVKKISVGARRRVEECFSIGKNISAIENAYKEMKGLL